MKRALLILAALTLAACAPVVWVKDRFECGLKCPANSSCEVVSSGVFTSSSGCVCKYGQTARGSRSPSKGDPCPPSPAPKQ